MGGVLLSGDAGRFGIVKPGGVRVPREWRFPDMAIGFERQMKEAGWTEAIRRCERNRAPAFGASVELGHELSLCYESEQIPFQEVTRNPKK